VRQYQLIEIAIVKLVPVRGVVQRVRQPGPRRFVLRREIGWEAIPGHQVEGEAMHGEGQITNDQAPMTNRCESFVVCHWSLGFGHWSFVLVRFRTLHKGTRIQRMTAAIAPEKTAQPSNLEVNPYPWYS